MNVSKIDEVYSHVVVAPSCVVVTELDITSFGIHEIEPLIQPTMLVCVVFFLSDKQNKCSRYPVDNGLELKA